MHRIFLAIVLLLTFFSSNPQVVYAQKKDECANHLNFEWLEEKTNYFAILHTSSEIWYSPPFEAWRTSLDLEYERFHTLFQSDLNLPISIVLYPTEENFSCTNRLLDAIPKDLRHTTIGQREISFILENVVADPRLSKSSLLNDLRYELAGLFVNKITDGKAPIGLLYGLKLYVMEPAQIHILPDGASLPINDAPAQSWRYILENEATAQNPILQLNAVSIVAFLGDAYGWINLMDFIQAIPRTENYREALLKTYKTDLTTMESQWIMYYPTYFDGRWRSHAIYGLDLSGIEKLIQEGAYIDGGEMVKRIIPALETSGQRENLQKAQQLLEKARQGEEAGNLVLQARLALQAGEYQDCIYLVKQASEMYKTLGDFRRISELKAYQARAEEILALRLVSEELSQQLETDPAAVNRLRDVGKKQVAYGYDIGLTSTQKNLNIYLEGQLASKEEWGLKLIPVIMLFLLARLLLIFDKRRPEAL